MSALAGEHKAVNLGQGFPDLDGPEVDPRRRSQGADGWPQPISAHAGPSGTAPSAVGACQGPFYGLDYDWRDEVLVTSGGTEALTAAIMALAGPGDEVVLIEPTYDSYRPIAEAAGAVVKTVTLAPPGWRLTEEALKAAITPKTRAMMINSPLNPIGRVFEPKRWRCWRACCPQAGAVRDLRRSL